MTTTVNNKQKPEDVSHCFVVEWYDSQADLVRKYHLFYFSLDNTIEMYDVKARRTFLKRGPYPSIKPSDLFIGSQIAVYSRQLKVVGYGDEFTRKKLENVKERTLAVIKPEGYERIGKIIDLTARHQLVLSRAKLAHLSTEQAVGFFGRGVAQNGGPVVALELVGENAVEKLGRIVAGDDMKAGGKAADLRPLVYVSNSANAVEKDISFFFENGGVQASSARENCTVCVIKPHLVAAGLTGQVIDAILEDGYEISGLETFQLEKHAAEEFLEVYNTVVPEYHAHVDQLSSGLCVALEIRGNENVVSEFRELVGPSDPEIARHIRPKTLRARFGTDKVKNGIHCTDLPEDGVLESDFFFQILQPRS